MRITGTTVSRVDELIVFYEIGRAVEPWAWNMWVKVHGNGEARASHDGHQLVTGGQHDQPGCVWLTARCSPKVWINDADQISSSWASLIDLKLTIDLDFYSKKLCQVNLCKLHDLQAACIRGCRDLCYEG